MPKFVKFPTEFPIECPSKFFPMPLPMEMSVGKFSDEFSNKKFRQKIFQQKSLNKKMFNIHF